jgi:hypothetical protein
LAFGDIRRRAEMRVVPAWPRFSIRTLLALILFIGVSIAALRGATAVWASVMILAALGAICGATVGAALIRGSARAAWLGFAVFGWAYFLLCLSPWGGEYGLGPARFLTRAANGLLLRIDPGLVEMPVGGAEEFVVFTGTGKSRSFYHGVFHALMTVLFATTGAIVSSMLVTVQTEADGDRSRP